MQTLYIVATPIGNLSDMSPRAITVLKSVDYIAAEDTRHTRKLCGHFGIGATLIPLHEHNETVQAEQLLNHIPKGGAIALVSDAGTPLISDPGFLIVKHAHAMGIKVEPIPGPCALIAALCASGLPTDRFVFCGFLHAKVSARKKELEALQTTSQTLVFYESPHRIVECLQDMVEVFGEGRAVTYARELTKTFETIKLTVLSDLLSFVKNDPNQQKGEIVLVVAGCDKDEQDAMTVEAEHVLRILMEELPLKKASHMASKLTGVHKRVLYDRGLLILGKKTAESSKFTD